MNSSARVTSVDALRRVKTAMDSFDGDARSALAALTLEVRRILDWIEHDRPQYWPRELRRAFDQVTEARNDLERCMMRSGDQNARSCYDEKKAVERAKKRVRTCQEKIQAVKHWRRQLRHDAEEFSGQLAKLETHMDIDWARATASIHRMIAALDKYVERQSPIEVGGTPARKLATDLSDSAPVSQPTESDGEAGVSVESPLSNDESSESEETRENEG